MKIRNLLISIFFVIWFSGCSATLNEAIQKGDLDDIKSTVSEDKAKINARDESGNTILHNAVREGKIEIVKYLLSQDADVNIKNSSGETSLQIAIYANNEELIHYLVSNGADVNFKNNADQNALDLAKERNNQEIVVFLESSKERIQLSKAKKPVAKAPVKPAVVNKSIEVKPTHLISCCR